MIEIQQIVGKETMKIFGAFIGVVIVVLLFLLYNSDPYIDRRILLLASPLFLAILFYFYPWVAVIFALVVGFWLAMKFRSMGGY